MFLEDSGQEQATHGGRLLRQSNFPEANGIDFIYNTQYVMKNNSINLR